MNLEFPLIQARQIKSFGKKNKYLRLNTQTENKKIYPESRLIKKSKSLIHDRPHNKKQDQFELMSDSHIFRKKTLGFDEELPCIPARDPMQGAQQLHRLLHNRTAVKEFSMCIKIPISVIELSILVVSNLLS